jgi:hypothetical protein
MSLVTLLCIILLAGVIAFLIKKAPFIDEPYKGYALWVLLVVVVLWIAFTLLGPFPNPRIPGRNG